MAFHGNCIFFLLGLMILSVLVRVLVGGLRAHHTPSVPRDVAGHRQTPHGDVQSEGDAKENAQAMLVPDKGSAPKANKPVPVEGATTGAAMSSKDEAKHPPPLRPPELLLSRQVESEGLLRLWEGLKDAESTFFEQSEQIADRIEQLEVLVDR